MFDIFSKKKTTKTIEYPPFSDIHCHMLSGLDDGAPDDNTMKAMIDMAYAYGTKTIAFTPHIRRPWLKRPDADVVSSFERACDYVQAHYGDMKLALGCEVYYYPDVFEEHGDIIRSYSNTDYLLVEFSPNNSYFDITSGLQDVISRGYSPVLAHVERYPDLWKDIDRIYNVHQLGTLLQVNCDTLAAFGDKSVISSAVSPGRNFKKQMDSLLEDEMISFLSTDAHNLKERRPVMTAAYDYVIDICDSDYADAIASENAVRMLKGEWI